MPPVLKNRGLTTGRTAPAGRREEERTAPHDFDPTRFQKALGWCNPNPYPNCVARASLSRGFIHLARALSISGGLIQMSGWSVVPSSLLRDNADHACGGSRMWWVTYMDRVLARSAADENSTGGDFMIEDAIGTSMPHRSIPCLTAQYRVWATASFCRQKPSAGRNTFFKILALQSSSSSRTQINIAGL